MRQHFIIITKLALTVDQMLLLYFQKKFEEFPNIIQFNFFDFRTRISQLDERHFPDKSDSEYLNSCKDGVKKNETVTYDFINQ
ncbi:unnamed protein product, partial [Brugia pahangi]|uniref:Uncharacterized protein n=1 Tax=Brugia pahangi TaxID=6280 RepID=A0A0N4THV8_BRUPA